MAVAAARTRWHLEKGGNKIGRKLNLHILLHFVKSAWQDEGGASEGGGRLKADRQRDVCAIYERVRQSPVSPCSYNF